MTSTTWVLLAKTQMMSYNEGESNSSFFMNIFVVDTDPVIAAQQLPDRHVTKMILESAQMLSVVFSPHYWDIGEVMKVDGTPFKTAKGAFKNHPCTQWVAAQGCNAAWLIQHALGLCDEFQLRYSKPHGLHQSLINSAKLFQSATSSSTTDYLKVANFARAMPEDLKFDTTISDVEAYQRYLNTKEWCYNNYLRLPGRRPAWLLPTSD